MRPDLVRTLGLWSSIGLVIGITIGSGIFRTPAGIATRVPDPLLMLGVWVLGGLITACGALSIAELAAAFPSTGGLYVYLREGWGRVAGFLFGWAQLVLIRASAVGAISTVFAEYLLRSTGFSPDLYPNSVHYLAAAAIIFAALVNIRGVDLAARIVGTATIAKYGALAGLVLAAFLLGGRHGASFDHFVTAAGPVQIGAFGLALISVLWAYDGFADLSFAGGEVRNPQRNLPRALILGTTAIVVIYLLANAAYLYVQPVQTIAKSRLVAADTMSALFGPLGVAAVSVVVMISTFGSLNGTMLVNPRIFFAMASDGLFFRAIARVHPVYRTPYVAVGLTAALGVALVLTRTFEQLSDTFVLAMGPFYWLTVAGLIRLRRTRPDLDRPYRVVGYPFVPLIFLLGISYMIVNALLTRPLWSSVVFAVMLVGIPVFFLCFRNQRPA